MPSSPDRHYNYNESRIVCAEGSHGREREWDERNAGRRRMYRRDEGFLEIEN